MAKPKNIGGRPIDVTQLQTEAGRRAAAQINRSIEASHTRIHRLTQVLIDFSLFPRAGQLALTEAAIMWAFASMARHARAADAESRFYSLVDGAYVLTQDAFATTSESERNQIDVAATAIHDHLLPNSGSIFGESVHAIQRLTKEDPIRALAETLWPIYQRFLDHASAEHLNGLVMHCYRLCLDLDSIAIGIECDLAKAFADIYNDFSALAESVQEGLRDGRFVIKEGKLVAVEPIED